MEGTILPIIKLENQVPETFLQAFFFPVFEYTALTEKTFSFAIFEKWKKMMLCPYIALVFTFIK